MKRILKVCMTVGLIGLLIYRMDWQRILPTVSGIPWWALIVALATMVWEFVVSSLRWSVALRIHQLQFAFPYLFRVLANAYFFNNFLPTAIGGDAYRVYRTLPNEGYRSRSVSAVIVDRASGLAMLLVLGAVAAMLLRAQHRIADAYLWLFALGSFGGVLAVEALRRGWLKFLTARIRHTAAFDAVSHNWQHLLAGGAQWIRLVGWSLVFQATSILLVYWLFKAVGHPQPLVYCALMTAASGVAALLPLSINGIGLMEGSLVAMAVALGVDYDVAAIVAILRRLLMFTLSLLCGLSYLLERQSGPLSSPAPR